MEFYLPIHEVAVLLGILSIFGICFAAIGIHSPLIPAAILTGICLNFDLHNQTLLGDYNFEFKHAFSIVEKFALILLLFAAGLEVDIKSFAKTMHIALSMLGLQVLASFLCMQIISFFVSLDFYLVCLYSFVLTLSSTMCAAKAIESCDGNYDINAMQILIIQDIALAAMLFVLESTQCTSILSMSKVVHEISLYILPLVVLFVTAYLTQNWHKPRLSDLDHYIVLPLSCCAFVSGILHINNMSCEYGAFIAGLALGVFFNTSLITPAIDQIAAFFSVGFFISLGLKANTPFIWSHALLISSLALLIFIFKTVLNAVGLQWASKQPDSWYNALLLSTPSELSFVLLHSVAQIAEYKLHINLIESLVLICILASSFWFSALLARTKPV